MASKWCTEELNTVNSRQLEYPRGIGNRSSYREFRVIESQILGWVALRADEIVRVKGRFEF